MAISAEGRVLTCNERFLDLWEIPREALPELDIVRLNRITQALSLEHHNSARLWEPRGTREPSLDTLPLQDGRTLEVYSPPAERRPQADFFFWW